MSAPLRFLGLALLAWVGVRYYSHSLEIGEAAAAFAIPPPPSSPIAGLAPEPLPFSEPALPATAPAPPPAMAAIAPAPPIGRSVTIRLALPTIGRSVTVPLPPARPLPVQLAAASLGSAQPWFSPAPPLDEWPLTSIAGPISRPRPAGPPTAVTPAAAAVQPLDRLALSSWAIMRQTHGPAGLGTGGTLGGSQAGARLSWAFNRSLAASLRLSGPVNGQRLGGEAALGLAWQPLRRVPLRLLVERRHALGRGGGRSAFALLAEGGLYERPLPLGLKLDAYAQAGVVGVRTHDLFAEGAATATRPLGGSLSRFSVGAGVWGGIQPGLSRLDVGPRLSMRFGRSMRIHLDYRHKVAGNALPGSGPTVSFAGDF